MFKIICYQVSEDEVTQFEALNKDGYDLEFVTEELTMQNLVTAKVPMQFC